MESRDSVQDSPDDLLQYFYETDRGFVRELFRSVEGLRSQIALLSLVRLQGIEFCDQQGNRLKVSVGHVRFKLGNLYGIPRRKENGKLPKNKNGFGLLVECSPIELDTPIVHAPEKVRWKGVSSFLAAMPLRQLCVEESFLQDNNELSEWLKLISKKQLQLAKPISKQESVLKMLSLRQMFQGVIPLSFSKKICDGEKQEENVYNFL